MFYKVIKIRPLQDFILEVNFENQEKKYYDIKPLFEKWSCFNILKNKNLFEQVKIDVGGYGISWNEELDLSCNELYQQGFK